MEGTRRQVATLLGAAALQPVWLARALAQPAPTAGAPAPDSAGSAVVTTSQDTSARMTVPVMINGQGPYPFVVDTGSDRTVISARLAQTLNLPLGQPVRLHSATGIDQVSTARIARLTVGAREVKSLEAPALDETNLGCLGILGIDAMSEQEVVLDFRAGQITIRPSMRQADQPDVIVVRAKSRYGQLLLVDSSVNGVPLYVIIDTGGDLTIGNPVLRETLSRRKSQVTEAPIEVIGVTGTSVTADMATMPEIKIGGIRVNNMPIAYADLHAFSKFGLTHEPAMLLGVSVLRHFDRVSLDFKARQVRFLMSRTA